MRADDMPACAGLTPTYTCKDSMWHVSVQQDDTDHKPWHAQVRNKKHNLPEPRLQDEYCSITFKMRRSMPNLHIYPSSSTLQLCALRSIMRLRTGNLMAFLISQPHNQAYHFGGGIST